MIRFACPKCRKVYAAEPGQAGRQAACKQCDAIVVIPERPIREVHYGVALPPSGVVETADESVPVTEPVPPAGTAEERSTAGLRRSGFSIATTGEAVAGRG